MHIPTNILPIPIPKGKSKKYNPSQTPKSPLLPSASPMRRRKGGGSKAIDPFDTFGDAIDNSMGSTRSLSKSALDSLLSQRGRKLPRPERPQNDNGYGEFASLKDLEQLDMEDTDSSMELPTSTHEFNVGDDVDDGNNDDEDNEDEDEYDDLNDKQEFIDAYNHGDDPNKVLNSWKNKNKKQLSSATSNSQAASSSSSYLSSDLDGLEGNIGITGVGSVDGGVDIPQSGGGVTHIHGALMSRLPGPPHDLVAQIVKPRFVTLSWMEPKKNPVEVVSYTVFYKMSNSER